MRTCWELWRALGVSEGAVEILLQKLLPVRSLVLKLVQLGAVGSRWLLHVIPGPRGREK